MARSHPQQTYVPAGDTIEISLDWLPAPQRLPGHTHDEFMAIKAEWCRDLTNRWRWWMDHRDHGCGSDPHVGVTPDALAQAVLRFCWAPAIFRQGRRHGDFFLRSRILAFDVDDGTPYTEVRGWLAGVGITPLVAYHSPSSKPDHQRFRVVLLLDSYVTDAAAYGALMGYCITHLLRGHCDPGSADAARVYFPGREIIESNDPSRCLLSVGDVLAAIEVGVRESDRHGNAARTMRDIRRDCGAADDGTSGRPGTGAAMAPGRGPGPIETPAGDGPTATTPVPGGPSVDSGGTGDGFTPFNDSSLSLGGGNPSGPGPSSPPPPTTPASREAVGQPQAGPGRTTSAATRQLNLRGFPEVLIGHCALASEFLAGLTADEVAALPDPDTDVPGWLRERELFGLMTNVAGIRGGRDWFLQTLASSPHLYGHFAEGHWQVRFTTHRANARHPQRCDRFCPHVDTCDHGDTMIDTVRRPLHLRILERPQAVPLALARHLLRGLVHEFLADHTPGLIDVVHAQAGLGKSEAYIREVALTGVPVIIAVPTHRLKDQIAGRLRAAGVHCLTTPEVPILPDHLSAELAALYAVGDLDGARRWILDHQSTVPELREYVLDLETALASDGTLVTTHARLLQVLDRLGDSRPVIIDEDPIRCLMPTGAVPLSDLRRLRDHMTGAGASGAAALDRVIALLDGMGDGMAIDTPTGLLRDVDPLPHLSVAGITSRVVCVLGSEHMLVRGSGADRIVHYCCGRRLPSNRRIILLSATASEAIYTRLFGPTMRYHDVPLAASLGRVIQVMARTYSRTDIERRGVPDLPEGYLFIGFRSLVDRFGEDAIGHFGAIEGLDDFGGRNIAVVGTPHMREETYHLLALALGRTEPGMERLSYRTVMHDGMEFRFMTYRDDLLRTIQLHLIGSELEQAVGRARVLTNDCTVRVYSNFPLRGATHEVRG